jgi:uncharacterized damage-inducible protein DinB
MANELLVHLFEHKAWCNRSLAEALKAAPSDADRREMAVVLFTFGHTAIVDCIFRAHLSGVAHDYADTVPREHPDLDVLAAAMAETDAWYLEYVASATAEELDEVVEFKFVDGDRGRMTKGQMLAHVITHGASHRGAIGKMLEGLGVAGASDMVTTFARQPDAPSR